MYIEIKVWDRTNSTRILSLNPITGGAGGGVRSDCPSWPRSGHLGHQIKMIKLILVDFDVNIANITLKNYTHVVYIHVYVVL